MKNMSKRGFTLIELLVVIAIIGILASIVLVSFPGATKRAKDSRLMSAISQARTEMVSYEANNGTYVGFAPSAAILAEVVKNSPNGVSLSTSLGTATQGACMYVALNELDSTTWYCADSTGRAGKSKTAGDVAVNPNTTCKTVAPIGYACPAGTNL